MRIAIVGTGAMGSLFASHLADTDAEVWAFDVWHEHIEAIRRDGLIVHRDGGARSVRLHATFEPSDAGACDAVMVFVKYGQTAAAVEAARPMIGPATTIVTLQNGIGNLDIIRAACPQNPVAFGLTTLTCELIGAGHIEASYKGRGETYLWPSDGRPSPRIRAAGWPRRWFPCPRTRRCPGPGCNPGTSTCERSCISGAPRPRTAPWPTWP